MSLQDTPRAGRLHIGLFGKRNAGKSSLVNALTNQKISLVSDVAERRPTPCINRWKSMESARAYLSIPPALTIPARLENSVWSRR